MSRTSDTLHVGDRAPDFTLPTQRGEPLALHDVLAKGPILLVFHRGTWCPNCRRRFAELARNFPTYAARGAQIVAVVAQAQDAVKRYIEETGLPFNILLDESRLAAKAYGVWHRLGLDAWNVARPALFLIGRDGLVRYLFVGQRQEEFPEHEDILREIEKLRGVGS